MTARGWRWGSALVVVLLASAALLFADSFEQITINNTAGGIGFTSSKISPVGGPQMTIASCRVRTAEISFTYDGTTPTSSVGTLGEIGDVIFLNGHDRLVLFRAIRTGATSGQLDCTYSP